MLKNMLKNMCKNMCKIVMVGCLVYYFVKFTTLLLYSAAILVLVI